MINAERRQQGAGTPGVQVRPGSISLVHDGALLVAILGTGVAVCLWSAPQQLACMAHFLEPSTKDRNRATARFGNVAIATAVSWIQELAGTDSVEAQIYGGAFRSTDQQAGAEACVAMARKVLSSRGVPVTSEDVGGSKGRKVVFDSTSGHVAVLKVHALRAEDWKP